MTLDLRTRRRLSSIVRHAAGVAVAVVIVFPIYWLVGMSFKTELQTYEMPPIFFPIPNLDNYRSAFELRPLGAYILNSVVITTSVTLLSVTLGSLAGYGFSRLRIKGKRWIIFGMLATRMIPPITLVFPLFLVMREAGLLDTKLALILAYTTFNVPFATFLMHGFFEAVPKELDEAAMIDGCTRVRAFFLVVLPAVRPGLVATAIMCTLLAWKDFLWALNFTYTPASQTIPIGITTYQSSIGVNWGPMSAVAVLSFLPLMLFALFLQKYMIKGLMSGAVKG